MEKSHRFLISYLYGNQPQSLTVSTDSDTLSADEAREHLHLLGIAESEISDIQIMGLHHPLRPAVRPGHYQQPEGNGG